MNRLSGFKPVYGVTTLFASLALGACGGGSSTSNTPAAVPDQAYNDTLAYSMDPQGSLPAAAVSESAAVTHHTITLGAQTFPYTATAGHLTIVDGSTSQPGATMFYVAFTKDGAAPGSRPVTFFYNGGPGSSSVYLMLGSFAPERIKTNMPAFTPAAPYAMETNADSLLDKSDLVFINPVGTGYSSAIAPKVNKDFWGSDPDAASLDQFIKRYLTVNGRWNSPKFLYGESYGTARSAMLAYDLHEDGVDLNGVTLQSSILDYSQTGNSAGILPTWAAVAWYYNKSTTNSASSALAGYMKTVTQFADGPFAAATAQAATLNSQVQGLEQSLFPSSPGTQSTNPNIADINAAVNQLGSQWSSISWSGYLTYLISRTGSTATTVANATQLQQDFAALAQLPAPSPGMVQQVSNDIGIPVALINSDMPGLNLSARGSSISQNYTSFQEDLLQSQGLLVGSYDGRVSSINGGIAANVSPLSGSNDPSITAVAGVYTAMWNSYLNQTLKYTTASSFVDLNNAVFNNWSFSHMDPTGTQKGIDANGNTILYTAGDLAATMSLNPDLKVMQESGYYDSVTPFHQTDLDLQNMPIASSLRSNLTTTYYPSGHMIYLDGTSRTAMKTNLSAFYDAATTPSATQRIMQRQKQTLQKLHQQTPPRS
ncbi:S10 family peptidase [Paraburkholderia phenazinium]|uniref:Serine carboxypeptidase n=1 Tax=Paraburkholderia phenazinium TaxID=60549 RepID=A0A1G7RLZ1_9BURK|nr:Serine carboxypeptidase [Paraburkholderia phenazinium]